MASGEDKTKDFLGREQRTVRAVFFETPLKDWLIAQVRAQGGWTNLHAHLDKAYTISTDRFAQTQATMQSKWDLMNAVKRRYTAEDLRARMRRAVDLMIAQGVRAIRTHIDVDQIVQLLPMTIAQEIKQAYQDRITIQLVAHPLQGLQDPENFKLFEASLEFADLVGGLPSRDRPNENEHFEAIFSLAKKYRKDLDIHVDQENNPDEHETRQLAEMTMTQGMEGHVTAVHAISLSAQSAEEQLAVAGLLHQAHVNVTICPIAALSMTQLPKSALLHNSIAPLRVLLEADVNVALGVDNIADLFMPYGDGDLWAETRMLMEATRIYDPRLILPIVTSNGLSTMNLTKNS
jgi:cytosine/adenosine deaminase-related metal-dependent hydrolase